MQLPSGQSILPAPHTDLIYAVFTNELGLFGAAALIVAYLLFAQRGFKTAMVAQDGFSKLLAVGLTAVFALQVFVIVGGVTKTIPLTGVTLPFVSYGGSSIVANFVLIALLLIVSDSARRGRAARGRAGGVVNRQIVQLYTLIAVLFGILVFATSWWTVWGQDGLEENTANRRPILEDLRVPRGDILADDGTRARAQQSPGQRRAEDLRARLPGGQPVRARDRLLVHRPARRARASRATTSSPARRTSS